MLRRGLVASVVAALVLAGGAQGAVSQTIYAYFDVDGGLQFRYADSSNIGSTIPPGTYVLNLNNNGADDLGVDHIFHLTGPGVDYTAPNVDTTAVFSVTFQAGSSYRIFDDLHPTISQTILATTAPAAPVPNPLPPTPVTSPTKPTSGGIVGSEAAPAPRGSLDGVVSATGKLSLTRKGRTVRSLKQGRYAFSVKDESRTAGFTVEPPKGKPVAITSGLYAGSRRLILALEPGTWFIFSPGGPKKSFVVVR